MRTIDAEKYVKDKMAADIARYPAGSVSKRDVIMHVGKADEETYSRLNRVLTDLVYDEAAKAAALRIPAKYTDEVVRLTNLAQAAVQSIDS